MLNPSLKQLEKDYLSIVPDFAGYLTTPFGSVNEMFIDLVYDDHNLIIRNNINTDNIKSLYSLIKDDKRFDSPLSRLFADYSFCSVTPVIYAYTTTFISDPEKIKDITLDFCIDHGFDIKMLYSTKVVKSLWNENKQTGEADMVRCVSHSKNGFGLLLESISGELTEGEAKCLMNSGKYLSVIPSSIFTFWMGVFYNK